MSKYKILIVDDEPGIRDTVSELLEINEYEVATAVDGKDALRKMQVFRPDLVLCDWMMPVMDGLELLHETRQGETMGDIPFIFITAKTERENVRLAMNLGADDFISKPFKAVELLESVAAKLNRFDEVKRKVQEKHLSITSYFSKNGFHEFNTPMNAIIGGLDFLTEYNEELDDNARADLLGSMRKAAFRMKRAYTNLLLYTKITRNEAVYSFNYASSPQEAYTNAVARLKYAYDAIHVDAKLEAARLPLRSEALELMLYELLDNALKFGDAEAMPRVRGSFTDNGKSYELSVSNAGQVMSEAEIAAVGPMVQFKRAVRELQGWGLGLFLVKSLCVGNHVGFHIKTSQGLTTVTLLFHLSQALNN